MVWKCLKSPDFELDTDDVEAGVALKVRLRTPQTIARITKVS